MPRPCLLEPVGIAHYLPDIIDIPSFTLVPARGFPVRYPALGPQAGAIGPGPTATVSIAHHLSSIINAPDFVQVTAQGGGQVDCRPGATSPAPIRRYCRNSLPPAQHH